MLAIPSTVFIILFLTYSLIFINITIVINDIFVMIINFSIFLSFTSPFVTLRNSVKHPDLMVNLPALSYPRVSSGFLGYPSAVQPPEQLAFVDFWEHIIVTTTTIAVCVFD